MYTEALTFPILDSKSKEEVNYIKDNTHTLFRAVCDVQSMLENYPIGKKEDYPNKETYQKALAEEEKAYRCIRTVFQYARSHMYYLDYEED